MNVHAPWRAKYALTEHRGIAIDTVGSVSAVVQIGGLQYLFRPSDRTRVPVFWEQQP